MAQVRGNRVAFGRPGIEPRWTQGNEDGVRTAYSGGSRLWFTLFEGVGHRVYYPTVDRPQSRDLQYLISDGESLFREEKRHPISHTERLSSHSLGYRITNSDPEGRYAIDKEVIADPHLPCLLQWTRITGDDQIVKKLCLYALCASPRRRRLGQQRLRDGGGGPFDPRGEKGTDLARCCGHRSVLASVPASASPNSSPNSSVC
jgi:glucoamylase